MEIYGNLRKSNEILGDLRKSEEINEGFREILGTQRKSFGINGNQWKSMDNNRLQQGAAGCSTLQQAAADSRLQRLQQAAGAGFCLDFETFARPLATAHRAVTVRRWIPRTTPQFFLFGFCNVSAPPGYGTCEKLIKSFVR